MAAVGLVRTPAWPRVGAVLVGVYGACLVLSVVFPPDPTEDFPPGSGAGEATTSGLLHLGFGALGFVSIGIAAVIAGAWRRRRGSSRAGWSRAAGVAIIVLFAAGAALSQGPAGVALLWLAVLVTWAWLAAISVAAYRAVPHPDRPRRTGSPSLRAEGSA